MKIAIGCDEIAIELKRSLINVMEEKKIEYKDFGVDIAEPVDYPDIAASVTREVQNGNYERGILVCGTGVGMALVANKFLSTYVFDLSVGAIFLAVAMAAGTGLVLSD